MPAELALDHPFGGLTATLVRPAEGVTSEHAGRLRARALLPELELGFSPIPLPADAPVTQQGQDRLDGCLLHLSLTAGAARHVVGRAAFRRRRPPCDGIGEMLWTAPFIPTVPGTDTYTDELW